MTAGAARIRPAVAADVPAIDRILRANDDADPAAALPPGAQDAYLAHLIARGTTVVAEGDAEVVGFAATVSNGRATHLADLFVLPSHHGRGIGRDLLAAVFADAWPRTTFASHDPAAMPLYIRSGMTPLWPSLYLRGDPRRLPDAPAELSVELASFADLARLEREWAAVDRMPEVAYWRTLPGAEPFVVARGGRPVAICLGRDRLNRIGRWIDRALVAPDVEPVGPLTTAIRRTAGGDLVGACVPGPSPLVPVLLEAGFRIAEWDVFLASEPDLVDPIRQLVNPGLL